MNKRMLWTSGLVMLVACGLLSHTESARGQETGKIVARGLDNPCGIAVHGKSGHVFVSMKGRVVRFVPGERNSRSVEIAGYPTDVYGKGPFFQIGPLGLAFVGDNMLAIGDGGNIDGLEMVRFYEIGEPKEKGKPTNFNKFTAKSGPISPGSSSKSGEGNLYGLSVTKDAIYVTCNGDDTKGWVGRIKLTDGKPGMLEPFIATKVATNVDAPTGTTISPDGHLVVGQLGEISIPGDSLLTFYDTKSGKLVKKHETGLNDIVALAYSPTGKLYALDFAWMDTSKGGLFRLDVEGNQVKATKIASVDKPTAMAFDKNGNLLVTAIGTPNAEDKPKAGHVLSFSGL